MAPIEAAALLFYFIFSDPSDYTGFSMVDLIFEPSGRSTECEDIVIARDLIVEDDETFIFAISPSQNDMAVDVGSPSSAVVTIVDDPEGMCACVRICRHGADPGKGGEGELSILSSPWTHINIMHTFQYAIIMDTAFVMIISLSSFLQVCIQCCWHNYLRGLWPEQ